MLAEAVPAALVGPKVGRRRTRRIDIRLDNVSITGIGFYVLVDERLSAGERLDFEVDGVRSPVAIRRLVDTVGPHWRYGGGAFLEPHPAVLPVVLRLLDPENVGELFRWSPRSRD